MSFPFEVFLSMLFGVVCVVFMVWVFKQSFGDGSVITTEYTSVPVPDAVMQAQTAPIPQIEFTNMRLLVYYSRIAVQAALWSLATEAGYSKNDVRDKATDYVLCYCKVDGMDIDSDIRDAIPSVVEHVMYESENRVF